jgi:hypothetical protein
LNIRRFYVDCVFGQGALEEQQVRELLKGLVPKAKVKALMARRDIILEKIAADREEFGDWVVFPDEPRE